MAAVQQRVLNWLYSILTSEYQDVSRTYDDVAQALSHYSSMSPRTEVFTYEHGVSALLLLLSGTLPVTFRGTTYRFPISLWIPHAYPKEAPLVYVTPADGMVIRPGQHIDSQGKIYHPYLVGWAEFWDKSNIVDFLAILRDVFAKEPPVVSRQSRNIPREPRPASIPPPVPPLPPDMMRISQVPTNSLGGIQTPQAPPAPPVPPPKPYAAAGPPQLASQSLPVQRDVGPPLPQGIGRPPSQTQSAIIPDPNGQQPYRQSSLRYESAPPLPPPISNEIRPSQYCPPNSSTSMLYGSQTHTQAPGGPYVSNSLQNRETATALHPNTYQTRPPSYPNQPFRSPEQQGTQYQIQTTSPQQKPRPPPPNLLDGPLTFAPPTPQPLVAPPIPPNPEKDMILHSLARSLYAQRQHSLSQSSSSLPGLAAQKSSMLTSLSSMQAEITSLESLSSLLNSNTSILRSSLLEADAVISSSKGKPVPEIDGILVAPTVVGNQLYELVCEERALADALFVLGRAVERGRVGVKAWVKCTRGLARECFLKKALVKKIGRGMGLAMQDAGNGSSGYAR